MTDKKMMTDVIDKAIQKLRSPDVLARKYAALALGKIGDQRAVKPLCKALEDENVEVCLNAARALRGLGSSQGIECLNSCLEKAEREPHALVAIAQALGEMGDQGSVDSLIRALDSEHERVRQHAAEALGRLGEGKAVPPLIRVLEDRYWCYAVARALGELGDQKAVKPLIKALKYKSEWVRGAAVEALGKLGNQTTLKPLLEMLDDPFWRVRKAAVEALAKIGTGNPQVIRSLKKQASKTKEPDASIREAAQAAIVRMKQTAAPT